MSEENTETVPPLSALERLPALLWPEDSESPDDQIYWLLDGARDPAIVALLERSGLESSCLYSGPLIPRLKAAAPWLVKLTPGAPASLDLLRRGWGKAWGIFIEVPAQVSIDQLRRHCKKFLRVRTEDRRVLMFRFYDPRVLGVFLPSCDSAQYQALLGPMKRLVVEQEEGNGWQVFSAGGFDAGDQ
ncbi:DUF4123 domain-containing protein [Pseudomonas huaxiensis]|uniref:DUF4123 domain-containing protein n=1 Tax=Pseudomonas huaxiensis TaxID=2213017 RepID=UPI000DA64338|nr:DUF4123 domain-containing protein [Pseudomonas huaxiensis]